MKILYLTILQDYSIRSCFKNWYNDLSKYCDVDFRYRDIFTTRRNWWGRKTLNNPKELRSIIRDENKKRLFYPLIRLSDVNSKYDWLVTDFSYAFITEEWDKIKIPKAMIIEDSCNGFPQKQMDYAVNCNFDIVFCRYKQEFYKYQKDKLHKFHSIKWLPQSVNLDMFKDYGLEKEYDVSITGQHFPPYYFYRDMAIDELRNKKYFYELGHYGYNLESKTCSYVDYAKFLNKCKISITGGLIYNRAVMKFFEIPACRCLLVSNMFSDLEELGFRNNENMVVADYGNLDKQMRNLLYDDEMRQKITDNGYNFIRKYHSGDVRARQFINELK